MKKTGQQVPLYLIGASGHAKVVIDIIERIGTWTLRGILDDDLSLTGSSFMDYPVLGDRTCLNDLDPDRDGVFIAIGNNDVRLKIAQDLRQRGFTIPTLIHPSAVIAREVSIGEGTVLVGGAVVNPGTRIGSVCILNTGCTVDHDGIIGDAVHVSPGVNLAGNVTVGDRSWIGIGSSVIEGRRIGRQCMVAAGAVVIEDVPDNTRVAGLPARQMKEQE